MAENIDDLTIDYYEEDKLVVQQLEKKVLSRGSWTTIVYLYREWDKRNEVYGAPKASIRRYQKRNGVFKQQSKFNISSAKQGMEVSSIMNEWFGETGSAEKIVEELGTAQAQA